MMCTIFKMSSFIVKYVVMHGTTTTQKLRELGAVTFIDCRNVFLRFFLQRKLAYDVTSSKSFLHYCFCTSHCCAVMKAHSNKSRQQLDSIKFNACFLLQQAVLTSNCSRKVRLKYHVQKIFAN